MDTTLQERIRELRTNKQRFLKKIEELTFEEYKIQEDLNVFVRAGDLDSLRAHIIGWNVHCESRNGYNALGWACFEGHLHIVKYLIVERGADPNRVDGRGRTPIIDAVSAPYGRTCNIEVVRFLIGCCVDVNRPTQEGVHALAIACRSGRLDVVRLLVEEGKANVHLRNPQGRSFLLQAVAPYPNWLNLDVFSYLIKVAKLDPCDRDKNNWTAIHIVSHESAKNGLLNECASIQNTILRNTGPGSWVPPAWAGG